MPPGEGAVGRPRLIPRLLPVAVDADHAKGSVNFLRRLDRFLAEHQPATPAST